MKALLLFMRLLYPRQPSKPQDPMCITIPGTAVEVVKGDVCILKVEMAGVVRPMVSLVDNPQIGDYVLVNSGTAVQKLSAEQVAEISKMWDVVLSELEPFGGEGERSELK